MKKSSLEQRFAWLWRELGGEPYVAEHVFAKPRRWRFDCAWPAEKVAVELEGGVWSSGRHTSGIGFSKDLEKLNAAVELGWRVLRYTGTDLSKRPAEVLEQVVKVLNAAPAAGGTQ
jgi:very-short-patch-repair endonuclease